MLYENLKDFTGKTCPCGKDHNVFVPELCIKNGAINEMPFFIEKFGAKKAFIIADENTYRAAGKKVCDILKKKAFQFVEYVISGTIKPDEYTVGRVVLHFVNDCDIIIAVGSGVINDTGKILSAIAKIPYIIVATAPSMDGYASKSSSVDVDGLKVSLSSRCADVIIGDLEVLKNAPLKMLKAGLGDMLAKYISIAEWRIAREIVGEYYCEEIAKLVRTALKKCIDNAKGLLERDETAVKAVFEGLVLCGIAMSFAGLSRPASGVEHYFSHIWDMRGLEFGSKTELHGLQCAVATLIAAGLYENIAKVTPSEKKALDFVSDFNYGAWSKKLSSFLGGAANIMIANERIEKKYDKEKHAERLRNIIDKWDVILKIVREEIPERKKILKILRFIKAPETPEELGIDCDLFTTFEATKDIRDKYVLSRLTWDLGIMEEVETWL
ncbi:MAG: sn-glycerol-1-phosphate dehydrogenase [Clostridia bacterium]|nr:sn-glycerol-1-phosphate dehydrogenase [Clostridia bacterium]